MVKETEFCFLGKLDWSDGYRLLFEGLVSDWISRILPSPCFYSKLGSGASGKFVGRWHWLCYLPGCPVAGLDLDLGRSFSVPETTASVDLSHSFPVSCYQPGGWDLSLRWRQRLQIFPGLEVRPGGTPCLPLFREIFAFLSAIANWSQ